MTSTPEDEKLDAGDGTFYKLEPASWRIVQYTDRPGGSPGPEIIVENETFTDKDEARRVMEQRVRKARQSKA